MGIRLLEDNLINKIAAGEVIERPASIVKELVENAMDAGSDRIEVHIDGGGIERIEVADNGGGIAAPEVPLALQRHATSKIAREEDLLTIATMGFRGEALPSIAAVSRLELYSQAGSDTGVHAVVEGGRELLLEPYPTAPGTVIVVRDVFFNTPARKKFLKTAVGEGIQVHEVMTKLALSRPDIAITYSNEKKIYFKTPGNGRLRDTVTAIYGYDFADHFWELEWQGDHYSLDGMISKPDMHRVNRKNQVFFINHRLVKSPLLSRAVEEAYRGLLLSREYPAVILFISIPADEVDVNVHPQKTEVRFRDDKAMFRFISRSIRARLDRSIGPQPDSWVSRSQVLPGPSGAAQASYAEKLWTSSPAGVSESRLGFEPGPPALDLKHDTQAYPGTGPGEGDLAIVGQCFDSYILTEIGGALWMVDQHAAHERIQYERLRSAHILPGSSAQLLAFPQSFDLSAAEIDLLEANREIFAGLGLEIDVLGPNSAIIRSAPALLQGQEVEVVRECLQFLEEGRPVDVKKELSALMACKQAIKAGQSLTRAEMAKLVHELLQAEDYKNCPHGRPTMIEISKHELEKRFKRK